MKERNCFLYFRGCVAEENIKPLRKLLLPVLLVLFGAAAQTEGALFDTYITEWRGGAEGAYSFTFDDGAMGQFQYAVPILNEHNIHATFFLIGASVKAWYGTPGRVHVPQMISMASAGHEIGNHTYSHPRLTELSDEDIHLEMLLTQEFFNNWGLNPVSLAYPYSDTDDRVRSIVGQYMKFARDGYPMLTNSSSWDELNPLDLRWSSKSTDHYPCIDLAVSSGTWAIGVFHAIGIGSGPTVEEFETFVKYVATLRDAGELWVDTVREIACYTRERSSATITSNYSAETRTITVGLQVGLGYPYIVPLTLRTDVNGYYVKSISQSEMPISYEVVNDEASRLVQYDVVPDGGDVTIELTEQASEQQVVCVKPLEGDLNNDCKVDLLDFALFAAHWLDCNLEPKEACFD